MEEPLFKRTFNTSTSAHIQYDMTAEYIESCKDQFPDEHICAADVCDLINSSISLANANRDTDCRFRKILELSNFSIAMLIAARKDVALITGGDRSGTGKKKRLSTEERVKLPIGIYNASGDGEGTWGITNTPYGAFGMLVWKYKPTATRKDMYEVFTVVKGMLRVVETCVIPYMVPVNNCVVDALHKTTHPHSPDWGFTSKLHVDLNLNATNPSIYIPEDGSYWDVDSWLDSLGSPEFVESIVEVIQAACLPYASRDKMVLFYSQTGNNGKGTICQLIRQILGEESVTSIPLNQFGTQFGLSNLPGKLGIIVDENSVSTYIKDLSVLKAVITGDVVQVNQKHISPHDYTFRGIVIECINALPKVDDKTDSFDRRLHIIPFPNCFTGKQKRYIKDRLIYRTDVLEYLLKKVLIDMAYRDCFTENSLTKAALQEYVLMSNSVDQYLSEILPEARWDLLPSTSFLYAGYLSWLKKNSPSARPCGRNDFLQSVRSFVATDPQASQEWEWTDSTRTQGYIDCNVQEPLLVEYDMTDLQNDNYGPTSPWRTFTHPSKLKTKYSGLKRKMQSVSGTATPTDTDTDSATD